MFLFIYYIGTDENEKYESIKYVCVTNRKRVTFEIRDNSQ